MGLDRKQSPELSVTLWIPTIWMLYTSSKPLGIWFKMKVTDPEAGSPLDRNFLIILMLIGLLILVRRKYDFKSTLKQNKWLIFLLLFMFISILWSNLPFISLRRLGREFVAVVMAFMIHSEPSPRKALESLLRRTVYILIPFSLLLIKYFPYYGREYNRYTGELMWLGVSTQKNGLGLLCMFSAIFLIWSLFRKRQDRNLKIKRFILSAEIMLLLLALYLLRGPGGTYSATSLVVFILGLISYLTFKILEKQKTTISAKAITGVALFLIIFGVITLFAQGSNIKFIVSYLGRESTLTGRTEVWAILLAKAMEHPLIGYGYGGFWTQKLRQELISGGHNGYLDVILNIGFIGLFLLSGFILNSTRKAHEYLNIDFDWSVLWLCLVIITLIHNITESSIHAFSTELTAIILFFTITSTKPSTKLLK